MRDVGPGAMLARQNRQEEAGREEARGEDRRGLGQRIAGTAAGHESAATAADAKRPALGTLQQDDANQRHRDHDVNQKKNRDHGVAFAFEGAVLSESATVWLGLASTMAVAPLLGLASGTGTPSVITQCDRSL